MATGPILPLDHYPGDATALQILGHGRFEAIAEPVRLGGGSALVVHPSQPSSRRAIHRLKTVTSLQRSDRRPHFFLVWGSPRLAG